MAATDLYRTIDIARGYFLEGRSKVELAAEYGISRFKIARAIQSALDNGLVEIRIHAPAELDTELGLELKNRYNLRHAIVARSTNQGDEYQHIATAAAQFLRETVTETDVLGVGWGRTLKATVDNLTDLAPCPVIQLSGVLANTSQNSMELARRISDISGGPALPLYSPLLLPDAEVAAGVRNQPDVAAVLDAISTVTVAVITAGSWDSPQSQLLESLSAEEVAEITARGVIADSCGHLLNPDGEFVYSDLEERMIAVTTEQLREIPHVILLAGSSPKAAAIRAVLRAGFVRSLVTDSAAAELILST